MLLVPCIVVIEDEPAILELLCDVFELEGFRAIGISRPHLAFAALEGVHPDLFLVDMMLPGMSGIDLTAELQTHGYDHTPMVAISAACSMCDRAAQSGLFMAVVRKPFELSALLDCVRSLVNGETEQYSATWPVAQPELRATWPSAVTL